MKKIFDGMTSFSTQRPKTAITIIVVFIFSLTPNAMFIDFDNSQDAIFPDNETVQLLNEIEDEYQASIDFIRFIDDIESGDLYEVETWKQFAVLEAILLEDANLQEYQYPLFGIQANKGMASSAMQWQKIQDPLAAELWIAELESAIVAIQNIENESLSSHLNNLSQASDSIPSPSFVTAEDLRTWEPGEPSSWLERLDSGVNLSSDLQSISTNLNALVQSQNASEIAMVTGPILGKLAALIGMQAIDYRALMVANLPAADSTNPWDSDGPVLTTFVVITDPVEYDLEIIDDVQDIVTQWAEDLKNKADEETGDSDISVFSFSQLATGQNANLGKELGVLNSICLLLLGFILWTKFRSKRDTANVLVLTVFAILATYGTAGLLTLLGVNMVFNADELNSILQQLVLTMVYTLLQE